MKKIYLFTALFFFFSTLLPFINVNADVIYDDTNIVTVTPTATDTELYRGNGVGLITELLRQGGSIDFTNANGTFANFFDEMMVSFDSVLTNQFGEYSGLQDIWINPFDFSYNSLTKYIDPASPKGPQNALKNYRFNIRYVENTPSSTPVYPDIDYAAYINTMNEWAVFSAEYPIINIGDGYGSLTNFDISQRKNYSYYNYYDWAFLNQYYKNEIFSYITAYIVNNGNGYTVSFSLGDNSSDIGLTSNYMNNLNAISFYTTNYQYNNQVCFSQITNRSFRDNIPSTNFNSLSDTFDYLQKHFKNINIYVDGVPWYLKGNENHDIIIGTDTLVTPYNEPIEYTYNQPVYIIPEDIWDRLELLFNQKVKVTFDDISDLIVDVNGQQAIAVYQVQVENLDLMYNEKYQGYTNIPYFDKNQIGNMFTLIPYSFVNDGITVVATSVSPIPSDILIVFGILFVFVLFACIINRLLE